MRLQQLFHFLFRSSKNDAGALSSDPLNPVSADAPVVHTQSVFIEVDQNDLQEAIRHFLNWCGHFNDHISVDAQQRLSLPALPSASESGLGLWLSEWAQSPANGDPRLHELREAHAHFHSTAQAALNLAQQGRMNQASTLLNTDFERSRARVLTLLRQMQKT